MTWMPAGDTETSEPARRASEPIRSLASDSGCQGLRVPGRLPVARIAGTFGASGSDRGLGTRMFGGPGRPGLLIPAGSRAATSAASSRRPDADGPPVTARRWVDCDLVGPRVRVRPVTRQRSTAVTCQCHVTFKFAGWRAASGESLTFGTRPCGPGRENRPPRFTWRAAAAAA